MNIIALRAGAPEDASRLDNFVCDPDPHDKIVGTTEESKALTTQPASGPARRS